MFILNAKSVHCFEMGKNVHWFYSLYVGKEYIFLVMSGTQSSMMRQDPILLAKTRVWIVTTLLSGGMFGRIQKSKVFGGTVGCNARCRFIETGTELKFEADGWINFGTNLTFCHEIQSPLGPLSLSLTGKGILWFLFKYPLSFWRSNWAGSSKVKHKVLKKKNATKKSTG